MQLGIIGLPQSGKTTLYKALTRADIATDMSTGQMEVHTSVVDVPDAGWISFATSTTQRRSCGLKLPMPTLLGWTAAPVGRDCLG